MSGGAAGAQNQPDAQQCCRAYPRRVHGLGLQNASVVHAVYMFRAPAKKKSKRGACAGFAEFALSGHRPVGLLGFSRFPLE